MHYIAKYKVYDVCVMHHVTAFVNTINCSRSRLTILFIPDQVSTHKRSTNDVDTTHNTPYILQYCIQTLTLVVDTLKVRSYVQQFDIKCALICHPLPEEYPSPLAAFYSCPGLACP